MIFKKDEEEVELKFGRDEAELKSKGDNRSKMDDLFNPSATYSAQKSNDLEEKIRLLEYKIEKIIEQNSRIIDLLERNSSRPPPERTFDNTLSGMGNFQQDNDNERLW